MKMQCDPIILEAKRVILQEQLEKISNFALSNINYSKRSKDIQKDDPPSDKENKEENNGSKRCDSAAIYRNEAFLDAYVDQKLILHHFNKWKQFVKDKSNQKKQDSSKDQRKKLDEFIANLKELKKKQIQKDQIQIEQKITTNKNTKLSNLGRQSSLDASRSKSLPGDEKKLRKVKTAEPDSYKNRFEAQKNVIEMQKIKLEEQEKLIEALKMGKLKEDLHKSMESAKNNIRDIFQSASVRVKCKVNPILAVGCSDKYLELELSSRKAPKFVQEMEKRAQERALKREIIYERKRILDEQRKRIKEQALEAKRVQDEEEKKRNLEAMKERRRKELEVEKRKQMVRQKLEQQFKFAEMYHCNKLKHKYFHVWVHRVIEMHLNEEHCKRMYRKKLLSNSFGMWTLYYQKIEDRKNAVADGLFHEKILRRVFNLWKTEVNQSKQSMQVAQDFYDMRLESKVFRHWHRYVCTQYMLEIKLFKTAERHYKRRILFQYFYQWRSLPAVLQLEKAKEEKRQKWRQKVWEVLPDYQPPVDV